MGRQELIRVTDIRSPRDNSIMKHAPHFSHVVIAGPFLFVSGQMAFGPDGTINGHDVVQQTGQVLANIDTLLRQHDLRRENVVKTTVWLRRRDDFWEFNRAYAEFFGTHRPSRSTVITDLALEGAVVEIEATAFVGSPKFGG